MGAEASLWISEEGLPVNGEATVFGKVMGSRLVEP